MSGFSTNAQYTAPQGSIQLLGMFWYHVARKWRCCRRVRRFIEKERKMETKPKEQKIEFVERADSRRPTRNLAAVVHCTSLQEDYTSALKSVVSSSQNIREVHVVNGAYLEKEKSTEEILKQCREKKVRVIMHKGQFFMDRISASCHYLVDIPSACWVSKEAIEDVQKSINDSNGNLTRWSIAPIWYSKNVSLFWGTLTLMLLFYNWLRGMFTWVWKTQDGQNVRIFALFHAGNRVILQPENSWRPWLPYRKRTFYGNTKYCHLNLDRNKDSSSKFFYVAKKQKSTGWFAMVFLTLFLVIFCTLPFYTWSGATFGPASLISSIMKKAVTTESQGKSFEQVFQEAAKEDRFRAESYGFPYVPGNRIVTIIVSYLFALMAVSGSARFSYQFLPVLFFSVLWPLWIPLFIYGRYLAHRDYDIEIEN